MLPFLTVKFIRTHLHNVGLRCNVCWDGTVDSAGIASPHASPGAANIDWTNPLNPEPIPVWRAGGLGDGDGLDGAGYDGIGHPAGFGQLGDGDGLDGDGYDGLHGDYWSWTSNKAKPPITMRNGTYTVGIVLVDRFGNLDAGPAGSRPSTSIVVAQAPDSNERNEIAIAAGSVTLSFTETPSF